MFHNSCFNLHILHLHLRSYLVRYIYNKITLSVIKMCFLEQDNLIKKIAEGLMLLNSFGLKLMLLKSQLLYFQGEKDHYNEKETPDVELTLSVQLSLYLMISLDCQFKL